ncbi:MAG TPA: pyridoxal-dependent decarboxylase, partial [Pyrinomonadaceae bacterium]|nr:pyridoxal-dependent decarboxylase [Pyrinomonadaceae bacterium]
MAIRENITRLEQNARDLEPSGDIRHELRDAVLSYSEGFLDNIEAMNAFNLSETKGAGLLSVQIGESGIGIGRTLELIAENVDKPGLNPASGGHLGYIPGGGIYVSALGDYLADVFNRYAGVFYASPGAVRMENMLIRWMSRLLGYPETAGGNLTTGGSLANLIGIVTARDSQGVKAADITRSVIYLSEQAHHSIDKAIRIAGLGECIVRHLPLDDDFRIVPENLDEQISADLAADLNPFLVIASAGTTDVGA